MVSGQWSVVTWSVVSGQLVSGQFLVVPTTNCQLRTTNYELRVTSYELPADPFTATSAVPAAISPRPRRGVRAAWAVRQFRDWAVAVRWAAFRQRRLPWGPVLGRWGGARGSHDRWRRSGGRSGSVGYCAARRGSIGTAGVVRMLVRTPSTDRSSRLMLYSSSSNFSVTQGGSMASTSTS